MATISRIPFFLSISSSHCRKPLLFFHHHYHEQICASDWNLRKKHGSICFACAVKQTRVRKKVKSNEELRSEIMEFIALVGFPEDHVPSMKELSDNGRNDLANIVRRRGYKFIRELLANSKMEDDKEVFSNEIEPNAAGVCDEDVLIGQGERSLDACEEDLSSSMDSSSGFSSMERYYANDSPKGNVITTLNLRADEHESIDESSLTEDLDKQKSLIISENRMHPNLDDNSDSGEISGTRLLSSKASKYGNVSLVSDDTPSCSDIKADNVMIDDDVNDVGNDDSLSIDVHTHEHYTSPVFNYGAANYYPSNLDHITGDTDDKDQMFGFSSVTSSIEEKTARFIQNGYLDAVDDYENDIPNDSPQESKEYTETNDPTKQFAISGNEQIGYRCDSPRLSSLKSNGKAVALEEITHFAIVDSLNRNDDRRNDSVESVKDLDDEVKIQNRRSENLVEIDRLKFMLHEKELELVKLKEQIEKEKIALSVLQRKAETEINKAQKLISEKDAELQSAEESLSGLQEVEIEYWGDGNVVEVTGSFNGWQHHVEMELQQSKSIGKKQKCWSTLLWLYPGRYEIKFIVDGQWMIDPQKESITKGHIINNIIKVDR